MHTKLSADQGRLFNQPISVMRSTTPRGQEAAAIRVINSAASSNALLDLRQLRDPMHAKILLWQQLLHLVRTHCPCRERRASNKSLSQRHRIT